MQTCCPKELSAQLHSPSKAAGGGGGGSGAGVWAGASHTLLRRQLRNPVSCAAAAAAAAAAAVLGDDCVGVQQLGGSEQVFGY